MAMTEKYANFDLATGSNNGTSEANAWQTWGAITFAAGERVNFKKTASRFALGTVTMSTSGTAGNPVELRGYESTIGDGGKFQVTGNMTVSAHNSIVVDFDAVSTTIAAVFIVNGKSSLARCLADQQNTTNSAGQAVSLADGSAVFCWMKSASTRTVDSNGSTVALNRANLIGCKVIGSGSAAAVHANYAFRNNNISGCVIDANGDYGIYAASLASGVTSSIDNCLIYDASDGIYMAEGLDVGDNATLNITNNVIWSALYGINNADAVGDLAQTWVIGNAMGDLTSGRLAGFSNVEEIDPITLTADPFVNAADGDFNINNTAGGGAVLRAVEVTI